MNTISKIAVIGAMECEINEIKNILTDIKEQKHGDLKIFTGNINDKFVIVSQSGIGKVNAALNIQYILDIFEPDVVINTGVAGGLDSCLSIGDVVIATGLVQHDFDVTALGYAKGNICTQDNKDKPTIFSSNTKLVDTMFSLLKEYIQEDKIHKGIVATGDIFVSDNNLKNKINKKFNALAVEMEGGAIAQVAQKNNVPFVVVRAISDLANEPNDYKVNLEDISKISSTAIKNFIAGTNLRF